MREYFIVAIEGVAYQFGNFKEALRKYYALKPRDTTKQFSANTFTRARAP